MLKDMFLRSKLLVVFMLLATTFAFASEPAVKRAEANKSDSIKLEQKSTIDSTSTKSAVKGKIIDINTATEAELKSIPGIGSAYASKIIAARPYANKAQLKSRNVLPASVYEQVKDLIIARQPVK